MSLNSDNPLNSSYTVVDVNNIPGISTYVDNRVENFVTNSPVMTTVVDISVENFITNSPIVTNVIHNEVTNIINTSPDFTSIVTNLVKQLCDKCNNTPTPHPAPKPPIYNYTTICPVRTPVKSVSSKYICREIVNVCMDPWAYDSRRNLQVSTESIRQVQGSGFRPQKIKVTVGYRK